MSTFGLFIAAPVFIFSIGVYAALLVLAAVLAARAFRLFRLRVTLLLHRASVPADGTPLDADDQYTFAAIERGWDDEAPEPEYEEGDL